MRVLWYRTSAGNDPVKKYLLALPAEEAAELYAHLKEIENNGLAAAVTRQLRGRLWEIKYRAQRLLFVLLPGGRLVLLHAFRKSSKKAPPRDVDLAWSRMKEVLETET